MWGPDWWGPWMMLLWLVFLGLAVAGIVLLVRGGPPSSDRREGSEARRILDERFARGEIDEEEYRRRREILERR